MSVGVRATFQLDPDGAGSRHAVRGPGRAAGFGAGGDQCRVMAEILRLEEQFAIVSEAERPAAPVRVLKQDDTFAVYDPHGDIIPGSGSPYGLYHAGTRFLSCFEVRLGRRQPLLLSSTVAEDNTSFTADLTNPDVVRYGRVIFSRGAL